METAFQGFSQTEVFQGYTISRISFENIDDDERYSPEDEQSDSPPSCPTVYDDYFEGHQKKHDRGRDHRYCAEFKHRKEIFESFPESVSDSFLLVQVMDDRRLPQRIDDGIEDKKAYSDDENDIYEVIFTDFFHEELSHFAYI